MCGFNKVPCSAIRNGAVVCENFAIFADSPLSGFIIRNLHVKLGLPVEVVRRATAPCCAAIVTRTLLGVYSRCCGTMSIRLNPIHFHAPITSCGSPIAIVQSLVEVVRCKRLRGNRIQICIDAAIDIAHIQIKFNKATIQVECGLCCCTATSLNFPALVDELRTRLVAVCDG